MRSNSFLCLTLPLLLMTATARGQENAGEAAIHEAVQSYVKAFNAADAAAVAEHWADDAEYVLPSGEHVQGRKAIRQVFEELFAESQPPKIDVVKAQVRMVTKDVAMEEGAVRVLRGDADPEESNYLAIHVRQGKKWKLNSVRETVQPVEGPTSSS